VLAQIAPGREERRGSVVAQVVIVADLPQLGAVLPGEATTHLDRDHRVAPAVNDDRGRRAAEAPHRAGR
jgi:hypothetical protein